MALKMVAECVLPMIEGKHRVVIKNIPLTPFKGGVVLLS